MKALCYSRAIRFLVESTENLDKAKDWLARGNNEKDFTEVHKMQMEIDKLVAKLMKEASVQE